MDEKELESIKQLLRSDDVVNRKLGIALAISSGMTIDELVVEIINEIRSWSKASDCEKEWWYHLGNEGDYCYVGPYSCNINFDTKRWSIQHSNLTNELEIEYMTRFIKLYLNEI